MWCLSLWNLNTIGANTDLNKKEKIWTLFGASFRTASRVLFRIACVEMSSHVDFFDDLVILHGVKKGLHNRNRKETQPFTLNFYSVNVNMTIVMVLTASRSCQIILCTYQWPSATTNLKYWTFSGELRGLLFFSTGVFHPLKTKWTGWDPG